MLRHINARSLAVFALVGSTLSGAATAQDPCSNCTVNINVCHDLDAPSAMCGSTVVVSIANTHTISGNASCGLLSAGYSFSVTTGTSLTLRAGECEECRPRICIIGGKVTITSCPSWWPWGDPTVKTTYQPGRTALTQKCETSPEISCLCKEQGADCPCEDGASDSTENRIGRATSLPSTSFVLKQIRGADTTDRVIAGIDSLSLLDIELLEGAVFHLGIDAGSAELHLIGGDGSVEIVRPSDFEQKLKDRAEALIRSGAYLDVNDDGEVNDADVAAVLQNLGRSLSTGGFDYRVDVDADGQVTEHDLTAVMRGR